MQERGLCGERGGEEIRSLQGLISEDEEGGEEDDGEEEDGGKDEEDGEEEEQRLLVLGLPPTPSLATAPSNLVCSLRLVTPKYSSWRLRERNLKFFIKFSLDPSYRRGRVYKLKFCLFVCLSVITSTLPI